MPARLPAHDVRLLLRWDDVDVPTADSAPPEQEECEGEYVGSARVGQGECEGGTRGVRGWDKWSARVSMLGVRGWDKGSASMLTVHHLETQQIETCS